MGKLAVISDLHVDINRFQTSDLALLLAILQHNQVTHLHLAGDIANKVATAISVVEFFQRELPTTFNWGNHELPSLENERQMEEFPHPGFLNLSWEALTPDLVLLGYNGWYDYSFAPELSFAESVRLKNLFWYDRDIQRSQSDPAVNAILLQELTQVLDFLRQQEKQVILATHFVPRAEFIVHQTEPRWQRFNQLNAFLGSRSLGELLAEAPHVQQVVFGHTHRRFGTRKIGHITYSCQPLGYFFEWQLTREFMIQQHLTDELYPPKFRSLIHKNQATFDHYKKAHLAEEFQRGITYIEY